MRFFRLAWYIQLSLIFLKLWSSQWLTIKLRYLAQDETITVSAEVVLRVPNNESILEAPPKCLIIDNTKNSWYLFFFGLKLGAVLISTNSFISCCNSVSVPSAIFEYLILVNGWVPWSCNHFIIQFLSNRWLVVSPDIIGE